MYMSVRGIYFVSIFTNLVFDFGILPTVWKCLYQVRVITVFTVFRLLTDFVCLYNYEFGLSLCKIVRSSVILLLPLFIICFSFALIYAVMIYHLIFLTQ